MRPVVIACVSSLVLVAACGKKDGGPTAPTPTEQTRIIAITGNLDFNDVEVGASSERTITIHSQGTAALNVTGLTLQNASNFAASWTSGTIPAGSSQSVTIRFSPTQVLRYDTTLRVNGDHTSGDNTRAVFASGIRTGPLWTHSGKGNTVFDVPAYVTRVRIQGTWDRRNLSNFIVQYRDRTIVNDILRQTITYDGTHQLSPPGGTVEIVNSTNIAWTFTEVR